MRASRTAIGAEFAIQPRSRATESGRRMPPRRFGAGTACVYPVDSASTPAQAGPATSGSSSSGQPADTLSEWSSTVMRNMSVAASSFAVCRLSSATRPGMSPSVTRSRQATMALAGTGAQLPNNTALR